jgi:hypothetical protein
VQSAETKKRASIVDSVELNLPGYDVGHGEVTKVKINALVEEDHSHDIKLRTMCTFDEDNPSLRHYGTA